MKKHMTFDERVAIQQGLDLGKSYAQIAREIGRNKSTVSREVKAHTQFLRARGNVCIRRKKCNLPSGCKTHNCTMPLGCSSACNICRDGCPDFEEEYCPKLHDTRTLCNSCLKKNCRYGKRIYEARNAQQMYEENLSQSRRGISLTEEELVHLDKMVTQKLVNGISLPVICMKYADILPVSERTIYTYIDQGALGATGFELRRKLQRRQRKKTGPVLRVDKKCHQGRSYEDYQQYIQSDPDVCVVQIDSVIGKVGGKTLLTVFFTNCDLQLMFLRRRNTSRSVSAVFRMLRNKLGDTAFRELFQVILADRGSEFTDPVKIECDTRTGERSCRVFYCDPQNSNQKSNCERNHELIRYVIPKGRSMDDLTQDDVTKVMNHINSYPRKKWKGQTPVDLFVQIYGPEVAQRLGIQKVDVDSILLRPELLKK